MEVVEYSGKGSLGSANGFRFKHCGRGETLAEESLNLNATKYCATCDCYSEMLFPKHFSIARYGGRRV